MKEAFLQRFVFLLVPKVGAVLFSKGGQGKSENSFVVSRNPSLCKSKCSRMRYLGATFKLNLLAPTPGETENVSKDILPTKSSLDQHQWHRGLM